MTPLGIAVVVVANDALLGDILESLRRQGAIGAVQVWLDGDDEPAAAARRAATVEPLQATHAEVRWNRHGGRVGESKLMLDALTVMAREHRDIVVLDGRCFPADGAIEALCDRLDACRHEPKVFSVYGSAFGVEPDAPDFVGFQPWGWATTREKLLPVLAQLKAMYMMPEADHLAWVHRVLTPAVRERLSATGSLNVADAAARRFRWDSALALLGAVLGLTHRRTDRHVVYRCGDGDDGALLAGPGRPLREPPYNMIGSEEVWQFFHGPPPPQYRARAWFGLQQLDRQLAAYVEASPKGVFVELGAYDGLNQSNTVWLERRGWRGLLIEPVRDFADACRRHRPKATVVHAACVGRGAAGREVTIHKVGLMSLVDGAREPAAQAAWIERGESVQRLVREVCTAPARTLSSLIDEHGFRQIDLLSLDVEGYELEVLDGLDFDRHAPTWMLVEDSKGGPLTDFAGRHGYEQVAVLNEREFTRDVLFRRRARPPGPNGQPSEGVEPLQSARSAT